MVSLSILKQFTHQLDLSTGIEQRFSRPAVGTAYSINRILNYRSAKCVRDFNRSGRRRVERGGFTLHNKCLRPCPQTRARAKGDRKNRTKFENKFCSAKPVWAARVATTARALRRRTYIWKSVPERRHDDHRTADLCGGKNVIYTF